MIQVVVLSFMMGLLSGCLSETQTSQPSAKPSLPESSVSQVFGAEANAYISLVIQKLDSIDKNTIDRERIAKMLDTPFKVSLPPTASPDYSEVGRIVGALGDAKLIEKYLRFLLRTQNSADELRSQGAGWIYSKTPKLYLSELSKISEPERNKLMDQTAWGLANNYYGMLNGENARAMIVGDDLSVYESEFVYSAMATTILKKVLSIRSN